MLEYLYRAKFEGVPSSETCDLIEEFLLSDDVNRKKEILWQLVPETTDKLVENYINTAKVTAYNLLMDVTFPEQLMDTESGEERHKMVDDYISQMLANNEYWQKNKGTPWVEEMRQAMYKIPYIPLTQEQSKLQILMAESLRSEGSPYFPKWR